jgi:hypothetical protein
MATCVYILWYKHSGSCRALEKSEKHSAMPDRFLLGQKKICVFPVACLKIIGSVGRLFFFVKSHSYHSHSYYGSTIGSKNIFRVCAKKIGLVVQLETHIFFFLALKAHSFYISK